MDKDIHTKVSQRLKLIKNVCETLDEADTLRASWLEQLGKFNDILELYLKEWSINDSKKHIERPHGIPKRERRRLQEEARVNKKL